MYDISVLSFQGRTKGSMGLSDGLLQMEMEDGGFDNIPNNISQLVDNLVVFQRYKYPGVLNVNGIRWAFGCEMLRKESRVNATCI